MTKDRFRWRSGVAIMLATVCAHAAEPERSPRPLGAMATLAYLAATRPEAEAFPDLALAFRNTVAKDLRQAAVFHLLDPNPGLLGTDPSALRRWREAGADLMLRTVVHSSVRGKLLVECKCIQLGTQIVLFNKVFVGELQAMPRVAHQVVDYVVGKVTGTSGIADSEIVFARQTGPGTSEIFGVDRDGKNLRKLTAFGSVATHPAAAANGRLALVSYQAGPPQIWGRTRVGEPLKRLFPAVGQAGLGLSDLAWSPDGTRLAFIMDDPKGTSGIHVLDPGTHRSVRVTPEAHCAKSPSWNPAGTELAYVSDREGVPQVFVVGSEGGAPRQVTRDAAPKVCAAWSPSGDRIAYVALADGGGTLLTIRPDGADRQPTAFRAKAVTSLCWSPDGRWLLLGLDHGLRASLCLTDLSGTTQPFAAGLSGSQFPQWTRNHAALHPLTLADPSASHVDAAPSGVPSLP